MMAFGADNHGERLEFAPAPAWCDMAPVDTGGRDARALGAHGVCTWLTYAAADLTEEKPWHTSRLVRQATSSDGLQALARLDVTFDPRHERLIIHSVRVTRNGVERDVARREAFELLRREPNLERAMYDGRLTAHMVIPDVQVGDIVDTCFSIVGQNPVLAGTFSWWFVLQWAVFVVDTVCELRAPEEDTFTVRKFGNAPDPAVETENGVVTRRWRVVDAEPYVPEPGGPPWSVGFAAAHVARPMTWASVADVFRGFYDEALAEEAPSDLADAIDAIAAEHELPQDRAVEGLRLVQRSLRYHSLAIGEGGFRPRPTSQVWANRYGDCKDASVLLVKTLRRLGLNADCALVHTYSGHDMPNVPPNALAFNHCIVRLQLDGRDYWLDGTMPEQAGDLSTLTQSNAVWALPMTAGAELVRIPDDPLRTVREATEVWTFEASISAGARVELTRVNRYWRADHMRRFIANEGEQRASDQFKQGLEADFGSPMRALEAMQVEDDRVANVHTVREVYQVERPYRGQTHSQAVFYSFDDLVAPFLPGITEGVRREPLMLNGPFRVETRREFHFPREIKVEPWDEIIRGPIGLEGHTRFEWVGPRHGVQTLSLTIPATTLPPEAAADYQKFSREMRANNGISLAMAASNGRITGDTTPKSSGGLSAWQIIAMIIGGLALVRLLVGLVGGG